MTNEQQQQLWLALSVYYLDTEPDDLSAETVATAIRDAGISFAKAIDIDRYEVAPAVGNNLLSVAGVWDEFDHEWLFARCRANHNRQLTDPFFRFQLRLIYWIRGNGKHHWPVITNAFERLTS